MRLRGITLANFKSFAGEAEIPIGEITSIVGPNGAGKSNILDAIEKIAAMLQRGKHMPWLAEFFDENDESPMQLGATFELSNDEQHKLLKHCASPEGNASGEPGPDAPFRFVKYVATIDLDAHLKDEIWMSTGGASRLEQFAYASRSGNKFTLGSRDIKRAAAKGAPLPPMRSRARDGPIHPADLFGLVDSSLFTRMVRMLGSIKFIGTDRKIPPAVPVHESGGVLTTGQNLPSELNDLPRHMQDQFDGYMRPVTHGDPRRVEPRTVGSDLTLEVRERGLSRRARHTDLGSGQHQTLILGWQMFIQEGNVILIKEPELHLHAERQKQMLRLIRDKNKEDGTQFVIETHSPAFLGSKPGERVILVTKDKGRSSIAEIGPDNVGLIRREMGITHADALSPTNILFVEGPSDIAAFGPFLKAVSPEHAMSTMIYSLGGAHNAINLKMLIKYLEADGRRLFAILDENGEARRQVAELEKARLLDANFLFLAKNLEDEFDSALVAEAAREMAAEAGCTLALTAGELDELRKRGKDVATALKNAWGKGKCGPFSKVRLAEHMVRLSGDKVPPGIQEALVAAVDHFEEGAGDDDGKVVSRDIGADGGGDKT